MHVYSIPRLSRTRRHRRRRRVVPLAAVAALLIAACQSDSAADNPNGAGGDADSGTGEPVSGGTFVLGIQSDPSPLNPNLTTNGPTQQIGTMIYEPLVYFDNETAEPQPVLAESWEISDDGLTYTFPLVDAEFTNGDPLTSSDVKYTIEEVSSKMFAPFAQAAAVIDSVDDSDPETVVINLKEPFGPFLLSLTRVWILPAPVFEGTDPATNPASIDEPVGTGPFILEDVTRGSQWRLARNPDYWQDGQPYLDEVVARVMPDAQSATLALAGGEIQYISSQVISPNDVATLEQRQQAVAHPDSFAPNMTKVFFNTTRDITGDPAVRKALAMAIDREYLLANVFEGNGAVARSAFDSRLEWAFNEEVNYSETYPYDPDAAAEALDAAGYPAEGDSRFSLTILAEGGSRFQEVAEALRSMFLEIGVEANVSAPEASVTTEQAFTPPGEFDLYVQSYTTNWDPALGIARAYVSDSIGDTFGNPTGYSNSEVDQLFSEGASLTSDEERAVPYREVQEILAEDLPVLPLIETKLNDAHSPDVHGIWYAANWGEWQRAWVE